MVHADTEDAEEHAPLIRTAPWGYLRLRRPDYDEEALRRWSERIGDVDWERVFVFFKHEDEGAGPRMAAEFRRIHGEGGR